MSKPTTAPKRPRQRTRYGERLRKKQLDAWQIGGLLAVYNLTITFALVVLSVVTMTALPIWALAMLVSPVLFVAFWIWFTQSILAFYHRVAVADALLIAKIGVAPFFAIFLFSSLGFAVLDGAAIDPFWRLVSYYGMLFGTGSLLVGLPVVLFGLRHRIRITRISGQSGEA
jgi:hypothetical protein